MSALGISASRVLCRGIGAALVLSLCACSGGSGVDYGENDPDLIVAIGDSITFGIYDAGVETCDESYRSSAGYCEYLEGLTGLTVVNEGVCAERSSGGASRVDGVLEDWHPGVLLIDYSPNDVLDGTDQLIRNLRTMIDAARTNKTVPILGTLTPATGEHEAWMAFIKAANGHILELCAEEGIECADHYKAFAADSRYSSSPYTLLSHDGLHPNAAGYELMARTWHEALAKAR